METTSAYKQNIMPTFIQLQLRFEREKSSGTQDSAKSLSQQILFGRSHFFILLYYSSGALEIAQSDCKRGM